MTSPLPVSVLDHPHWRVNLRMAEFQPARLATLSECQSTIEATKVRLRGWDYPHVSRKPGFLGHGDNYIDGWTDSPSHLEYWRFYQSAQFLHLFVVREATEVQWMNKLRDHANWHYGGAEAQNAPGFFSLVNVIFTITEIFEFAARLCQRGTYEGEVLVDVRIQGAQGFAIVPDSDRAWSDHRALTSNDVGHIWSIDSASLVGQAAQHSLDAMMWFFERFGWMDAPRQIIARDQEKFLKGIR